MRERIAQLEFWRLIQVRNAFFLALCGSLFLNFIQGVLNVSMLGNSRTVVVPTGFQQEFWVNDGEVSASYLSEMARHVAYLVLNVTPETIDYNQQKLLQLVHSSAYGRIKNQMLTNKNELVTKKITTAFFITDIKPLAEKLSVEVVGDLQAYIGEGRVPPQRKTYHVQFEHQGGKLSLLRFEEANVEGVPT